MKKMNLNKKRCAWCGDDPLYVKYHDKELGVPVYNDRKLFEFLILEGAQAGLSWITILRKRKGYKKAFDNFDFNKIAVYDEQKVQELIVNPDIVRNKLKIRSVVTNAHVFLDIRKEFGTFSKYLWKWTNNKVIINSFVDTKDIPVKTDLSDAISKDLKKRGMKFVGSTIVYAYMQAIGMVNDHELSCSRYRELI